MDVERYQRMKRKVERARRESSEAEGALTQIMGRLSKEHGCDTLDDAKKKLKRMEKEAKKAERAVELAMDQFDDEWGDQFDG